MTEAMSQSCPDCGTAYDPTDNYCRRCGMYLAAVRPPTSLTKEEPVRDIAPARSGLPAPVKRAATAMAIGTALQIGVGLAGKYLAGQAAKGAMTAATKQALPRGRRGSREVTKPRQDASSNGDDATAVSETVLIRRVWVRRG